MLQAVDKALAGAIVVADDISATMKSVKQQGVLRTLGDAVEDSAGMVADAGSSVLGGVSLANQKSPPPVSGHSGMGGAYADLCAGPGIKSMGSGGAAAYAYTPDVGGGVPWTGGLAGRKGPTPSFSCNFAPGIGIQRPQNGPTVSSLVTGIRPAGVPTIPPYQGPSQGSASSASAGHVSGGYAAATAATATGANTVKDPPLLQECVQQRLDEVRSQSAENARCFDCDCRNTEWSSVSFAILLCIECAGHHRQLGTHISRIRSCKMDSWTERQLQIFKHGGNKRLMDFFDANSVPANLGLQRYSTVAAEWYRESWIKSCTLERPVPEPPAGTVMGPCVSNCSNAAVEAAGPKAAVDLLDLGAEPTPVIETQFVDLLDFGETPAPVTQVTQPADADLLGFGTVAAVTSTPAEQTHGDLLGLGAAPAADASGDLLGLGEGGLLAAAIPQVSQPSPIASLNMVTSNVSAAAVAAPTSHMLPPVDLGLSAMSVAPVPAPVSLPTALVTQADGPPAAANTLAGGAKLVKKEDKEDMFAMALEKWGM